MPRNPCHMWIKLWFSNCVRVFSPPQLIDWYAFEILTSFNDVYIRIKSGEQAFLILPVPGYQSQGLSGVISLKTAAARGTGTGNIQVESLNNKLVFKLSSVHSEDETRTMKLFTQQIKPLNSGQRNRNTYSAYIPHSQSNLSRRPPVLC